jgi:ATP-dependent Clp endopeptidase proteolytic subunit ClpP
MMPFKALNAKVDAVIKAGNERKPDRKRPEKEWFAFSAKKGDSADLAIYDEIGFWGTTAATFKAAMDAVKDVKTLNISINSPGGDVFDGFAIFNMLRAHESKKVITVDGMAASIASVIAMAGDTVRMPTASRMMIHNPWVGAAGDSAYLRDMADLLDDLKSTMVAIYRSHASDIDEKEMSNMMDATTWMGAETAKEKGFIDEVIENLPVKNKVNFGALANVPEEIMAHFRGMQHGAPVDYCKYEHAINQIIINSL